MTAGYRSAPLATMLAALTVAAACEQTASSGEPPRTPSAGNDRSVTTEENDTMDNKGLGMPAPKRVAPPDVPPVEYDGKRFEVVLWGKSRGLGQNGGHVAAIDSDSGEELWLLEVYEIDYDEAMESDVQDVFIETMSLDEAAGTLAISDEKGRRYSVDLATREVTVID